MEPDRTRASAWILKPLHKMGTNWLHFHCSAKVSAPEVMPLEGAASARRVTHAVYFPHARARARVRACALWWSPEEPVDSPRSASDAAINYVSLLLLRQRDFCVCVRVGSRKGTTPTPSSRSGAMCLCEVSGGMRRLIQRARWPEK